MAEALEQLDTGTRNRSCQLLYVPMVDDVVGGAGQDQGRSGDLAVDSLESQPCSRLRLPAGGIRRVGEPPRKEVVDERFGRVCAERVLDEAPECDLRRERRRLGEEA